MKTNLTRRQFLGGAIAGSALSMNTNSFGWRSTPVEDAVSDIQLVDYHVHLDKLVTLEKALQLSRERRVKFGIVEHAGTKENHYPGLRSTDEDLRGYMAKLEGKPVYRGIQAEGLDW